MIVIGVIFLAAGLGSMIYGINLNNNLESQLSSLFSSGATNPGTIYIVLGVVGLVIGIAFIGYGVYKKPSNK